MLCPATKLSQECQQEKCAWYRGTNEEGACAIWSMTDFLMGLDNGLHTSIDLAIKILEARGFITTEKEDS
jgi:hypothetical protein